MKRRYEYYIEIYLEHVRTAIDTYFDTPLSIDQNDRSDSYYKDFAEQLVKFSLDINSKANGLLAEARENQAINLEKLESDLFVIGKESIQKFTSKHRLKRSDTNHNH